MIVAFAYASVGWLLASIRPKNPIGWLFLGMGVVTAIQLPLTLLVADAQAASVPVPSATLTGAWLASSAHLPIVGILGIWAILVFLEYPYVVIDGDRVRRTDDRFVYRRELLGVPQVVVV